MIGLWWACVAAPPPSAPAQPTAPEPLPPVAWVADDGQVLTLNPLVDVHDDQPAIWPFEVPVGHRGTLRVTGGAAPRPLLAVAEGERCWVRLGSPAVPESEGRWVLSPGRWAVLAPGDGRAALIDIGGPAEPPGCG